MCQLMGMSANVPTDTCFSFTGLVERAGRTDVHRDGWGITLYQGKGVQDFRGLTAGSDCDVAHFLKTQRIKSDVVVGHIRQANVGALTLENTHPFRREMWGRYFTFAHNGQLEGIFAELPLGRYQPVGTTDSEHIFCWLLGQLDHAFPEGAPAPETLYKSVYKLLDRLHTRDLAQDKGQDKGQDKDQDATREVSPQISQDTHDTPKRVCNVLLTDGESLLAYCSNNLHWITRRAPFGPALLKDIEVSVDFAKETTPNDIVTVIATQPLTTNEMWTQLKSREMVVFKGGDLVYRSV